MRITGGSYRSRVVKVPPGEIRPAMDRMRESMFAIHTSYYGSLTNFSFLDLFSGSGIVALEAASRGCSEITLVEKDRKKRSVMMENLAIVDSIESKLYLMGVEQFLAQIAKPNSFDLIHLDPPFPMKNKHLYIQKIADLNLLREGGTLTLHYPKEDDLVEQLGDLFCVDNRSYGQSQLAFYRRTTSPA
ncbi:16S rRNA (guanine(966)-N(2))-methyltransferase RsmD [Entomospira culicis]|uniref:16S rRNA (Guanine(966)-N(2))-methyltransferase RsmD n=1 Tax=Entomospira culicis TaxID=2719989 RepID=A0A968GG84_9SPIO|nr:16S rRNA (guanine(966)-N(2))-methyltransferase RsmD [Entomospira culicis]NIZ19602.1 16S rRNA (guanine(966)-N(2))-methyltransferase RsmD [Entomospira culicis]NIZ69493.1 16S rRNA (guanine(966)-N(2))-methyltransferase RsmD [Entomospira culicis]WDI36608.1 16S rRNA (guanine(966)-N(2))-methyltransferase RsmD [Entomospira culicis]WDI38236.1 16S rRNA (guanine(966)-N(2))-methyltransferase RsmD [Entomospira culicis]